MALCVSDEKRPISGCAARTCHRRRARDDAGVQGARQLRADQRPRWRRSVQPPPRPVDGRHIDGALPRRVARRVRRVRPRRPDATLRPLVARGLYELQRSLFRHRRDCVAGTVAVLVRSLEAALWAFHRSSTFSEGALLAVNLGDDADTTGAVYGQLAGAYYGSDGIPEKWRDRLALRNEIESLADRLQELARSQGVRRSCIGRW